MRKYLSEKEKLRILAAQSYLCACGCGESLAMGAPCEFDHIVPLGLGGTNMPDNFQALTPHCHKQKTHGRKHNRLGSDHYEVKKAARIARKLTRKSRWKWPSRKFNQQR